MSSLEHVDSRLFSRRLHDGNRREMRSTVVYDPHAAYQPPTFPPDYMLVAAVNGGVDVVLCAVRTVTGKAERPRILNKPGEPAGNYLS